MYAPPRNVMMRSPCALFLPFKTEYPASDTTVFIHHRSCCVGGREILFFFFCFTLPEPGIYYTCRLHRVKTSVTVIVYEVLWTSLMAHMDRISMGDIHGVHAIRFQARARAPDLVLHPRETPRRYASMAQKEAIGASVRV